MKVRRIGIVGYDGVQALDIAGPADSFSLANTVVARKTPPYEVVLLAATKGPLSTESGIAFYAQATLGRCGLLDTIILPGGGAVREHHELRGALARWLRANARRARRVASVCTGTYALADSGLLDGRRATTHWRYAHDLQEHRPRVNVDADAIFVKDGKYYTSAGITAGIDLCLAFIEEDLGRDVAMAVAREMVVYLRRSGGQLQYSAPLLLQVKGKDRFDDVAQWIRGHLNDDLSVEAIAEQASLSPRHFTRKFKAAFGITPADFVEELRLDEARWLLVNAADPVEQVAKDVGYANDETFRRAFVRRFGVVPSDYRSRFGGAAEP
ncbi:MAG TPA: GlxA family transcriptional regulator [Candidatus Cybelea sp.]|jgi:transcriptional regulator GlxA family with amidase domain|nr:GlxA family transcriptional regulator [Candidatus Cybelea sp.]